MRRLHTRDYWALIAAVVLAAIVVASDLLIWRAQDPTSIAGQVQGYLAPLSIVLVPAPWLFLWWRRGRAPVTGADGTSVSDGVSVLVKQTQNRWEGQAHALGITAPVRVAWTVDADRTVPPLSRTKKSPRNKGLVTDLYERAYVRAAGSQIVLVGEGGAGKTGAMMLLLLEVLNRWKDDDPVPVWLNLSGWDPDAEALEKHAQSSLEADYPAMASPDLQGRPLAQALLEDRRISLFLDGLDEMPAEPQAKALDGIDRAATVMRVVVTARPEGYTAARQSGRLSNPLVVELQDVAVTEADRYLREGHDEPAVRRRFAQIADYISAHPQSSLATTLTKPLYLSLARQTFANPSADDPASLLDDVLDEKKVRAILLRSFLRSAYPGPTGTRSLDVLGWMAAHLRDQEIRWWRIPAWVPLAALRRTIALRAALTAFLAFSVLHGLAYWASGTPAAAFSIGARDGLISAVVYGVGTRLLCGQLAVLGGPLPGRPRILKRRRFTRSDWSFAVVVFNTAFTFTVLVAGLADLLLTAISEHGDGSDIVMGVFTNMIVYDVPVALAVGVVSALLGVWLTPTRETEAATPQLSYTRDRRSTVIITGWLVASIIVAVGFFSTVFLTASDITFYPLAFVFAAPYALCIAQVAALAVGPSSLLRLTEQLVRRKTSEHILFLPLLEEALSKQVLRQLGINYQFRHSELKDFLAEHHAAAPFGSSASASSWRPVWFTNRAAPS